MRYPDHLLKLISVLKKLPGVGTKTAERFAFHLLEWKEEKLLEMSILIQDVKKKLQRCEECGALIDEKKCDYCNSSFRSKEIICIIASPKDLFLIEETREYRGLYHVLGTLLSPIQGQIPNLDKLKERIDRLEVREIILALDSTLEGDATSLFLKRELAYLGITITRLALGLPMGSSLDFIDGGTLSRALAGRRSY